MSNTLRAHTRPTHAQEHADLPSAYTPASLLHRAAGWVPRLQPPPPPEEPDGPPARDVPPCMRADALQLPWGRRDNSPRPSSDDCVDTGPRFPSEGAGVDD